MNTNRILAFRMGDMLKLAALAAVLYGLYLVWDIVLLIFVAIIFAALIDPFATALAKRHMPRGIAVLVVYVLFFGIIGLAIGTLAPVVAHDVPQLMTSATDALHDLTAHEWVGQFFGSTQHSEQVVPQPEQTLFPAGSANGALVGLFSTVSGFFGGLVSLLVVLVMTFYFVSQDDPLGKILRSLVPDKHVPYVSDLFRRMRDKLGAWMRGQIILSATIGILVSIALSIVGVKYAGVLGLLAALLEFIPILGPIFAALPALFFAFTDGGTVTFVIVLAVYIVIQQLENHILVPKIMQRAVGLNPIISIIAILIGARVAGMVGVLLAIPVATALSVVLRDVLDRQRDRISTDV